MNVKYYCESCNHTVYAPSNTEPPCVKNLGPDCEMLQMEDFPAPLPKPKKVTKSVSKTT